MKKTKAPFSRYFQFFLFLCFVGCSIFVHQTSSPSISVQRLELQTKKEKGQFYVFEKKQWKRLGPFLEISVPKDFSAFWTSFPNKEKVQLFRKKGTNIFFRVETKKHWRAWSFLPALVAIFLCWMTQEPLTALGGGIVCGAFLLGRYDLIEKVFIPAFRTDGAAGILVLYLFLLGGLLGIWSKTGATQVFAQWVTDRFVRGTRSAKLVAWSLGVLFFQGGSLSSVLVGTTVKPFSDKEGVSHEELAYIVDSTSSPIASQLAFNAWPGYIQAFLFVSGVGFLATEEARIAFFFQSVPFCFYAIFAVLGTFLLCLDKSPFLGKRMKEAIRRSREEGLLDRKGSQPLAAPELMQGKASPDYQAKPYEFMLPLLVLIFVSVWTFVKYGSPEIRWAFGLALLSSCTTASLRGMKLLEMIQGLLAGLRSVLLGAVVLLFALTIGMISKECGGGLFLVEQFGHQIPFWALPVLLQLFSIFISFSTGTSWGTYAIVFPIAMPLAWAISQSQGLSHPEFYMTICFASVMDGSVYGDQCSPISDTTILSAMSTGCDLMDHVKTQIPQATVAALLASVLWTLCVIFFA